MYAFIKLYEFVKIQIYIKRPARFARRPTSAIIIWKHAYSNILKISPPKTESV